jgi:uncharacterized protein (TIGR00251 family)
MAIVRVRVIPGAKIDSVVGELATASPSRAGHGDAIKIKLRAPAVEGKANAALLHFLSEQLKLPRHCIVMERGHRSRDKMVRIDGLTEEDVHRRMREHD